MSWSWVTTNLEIVMMVVPIQNLKFRALANIEASMFFSLSIL